MNLMGLGKLYHSIYHSTGVGQGSGGSILSIQGPSNLIMLSLVILCLLSVRKARMRVCTSKCLRMGGNGLIYWSYLWPSISC